MLWEQPKWADVREAENHMSGITVKAIWDYLRAQISGLNKFYHDDQHGDRVWGQSMEGCQLTAGVCTADIFV